MRSGRDVVVCGDGPGLLLAHGAAGGIEANFGLVLDDLARDHRVVGPHYPGAGSRPPCDRLELDELADDLVAAARRAGLSSAVVIGESLGSAVAVRAATRHPRFVRGLVLGVGFAIADPVLRQAAETVAVLSARPDPTAARARAHLLTVACLSDDALAALDTVQVQALIEDTAHHAPPGTAAHFDLAGRLDVRADLPGVTVPTLAVVAGADRLVLPASHRRLAAGITGSRVVELPDAGHVLSLMHRRMWLREVRAFLDGLSEQDTGQDTDGRASA